jgi:2',3'-cyclic-nucleotide 2'-phosphodiesterase (5'-nucleotidase family)
MSRFGLVVFALSLLACGSKPAPEPNAEPAPAAVPAPAGAPTQNAPAPTSSASGKRIGIGFAANMIGEIEPCGCKANPTGGLARRVTILDAWRLGSPKKAPADPAQPAAAPATPEEQEKALKMAASQPESQIGDVTFDGFIVLDAGDTFADSPLLEGERLDKAKKTAALIVERFNAEGVKAQLVGDKDLALGRATLAELAKNAKYPFITTNIVDGQTRAPLFSAHAVVEVAGLKIGVLGLVTKAAASAPKLGAEGLTLVDPSEAAKSAVAELDKLGVDVVIALSQLAPAEEAEVAKAAPRIQLFLGGDQLGYSQGPQPVESAMSLSGGHKGRSVSIAALAFDDPKGAGAPFFDPQGRRVLERKIADAKHRVMTYEKLLAEAEQKAEEAAKAQVAGDPPTEPLRRRSPLESYRTQLAAARADLTLAEQQLAETPAEPGKDRNTVALQLVNLGREIADDELVKARVDAFRKDVPASGSAH